MFTKDAALCSSTRLIVVVMAIALATAFITIKPVRALEITSVLSSDRSILSGIEGYTIPHQLAAFGPQPADVPMMVTAELVYTNPINSCDTLQNPSEVENRIAIVSRGACSFATKAQHAQRAGAVAMLVINDSDQVLVMQRSNLDVDVAIPSYSISQSDAALIKHYITAASNPIAALSATITDDVRDTKAFQTLAWRQAQSDVIAASQ